MLGKESREVAVREGLIRVLAKPEPSPLRGALGSASFALRARRTARLLTRPHHLDSRMNQALWDG